MSYANYEAAMEIAKGIKFYTTVGGRTKDVVARAENMLGIKFSPQYRDFNKKYGYLSFFGSEIFGADPDDLDELEGNCVAYALSERDENDLPIHLIPIYNFDDGCMAYFDYSSINGEGEPRIVVAEYNGNDYVVLEVLADDFGDFLLGLMQEE